MTGGSSQYRESSEVKEPPLSGSLSHLDPSGRARMVDVTNKAVTERRALARGRVLMLPETARLIQKGALPKGEVLAVARVAGIMAAKQVAGLIPLCHPLELTEVAVNLEVKPENGEVTITGLAKTAARTGVEMEALTAVSISALTIYDMCKAVDKGMTITDICLIEKTGGKSGTYRRD